MFQVIVNGLTRLTELVEYAEQKGLIAHHAILVERYFRVRNYSLERYSRKTNYLH